MSPAQQSAPIEQLSVVTLVVEDQETALEWYQDVLGFEKVSDSPYEMNGVEARWLTIAPPENEEVEIALVEPDTELYDETSLERLHDMLGSDPWWSFKTSNLAGTIDTLEERGVELTGSVRETDWGSFAMIHDPSGNALQLFEPAPMPEE